MQAGPDRIHTAAGSAWPGHNGLHAAGLTTNRF